MKTLVSLFMGNVIKTKGSGDPTFRLGPYVFEKLDIYEIPSVQIQCYWDWKEWSMVVLVSGARPKSKPATFLLGEPACPYSSPALKVTKAFHQHPNIQVCNIFAYQNFTMTMSDVKWFSSLILFCVYAFNMFPPPCIALTGSPALRNFLYTASTGGDIIILSVFSLLW